jgi:hypothetical protein
MIVNFELVTDVQDLIRRDFTVADPTLVNPTNANPLLDGEFVSLNSSYQIVRAATGSLGFAVFAERGRFDVQAIGKTTVLFAKPYEADTRIFTAAGLTLGGALKISSAVSYDSQTRSGLIAYDTGIVIGYVTRLPANNGGKLRFLKTLG